MQIDLTCPCEAVDCSLPTPSAPWCSLTLRNVGDRQITSVEVTLRLVNGLGLELTRQIDREFSLSADPGECFVMRVSLSAAQLTPDVQRAEPVIEKVWYEDGSVWRKTEAVWTEVQPSLLPPGRALDELRYIAGRDAVGYPAVEGSLWICVCGRPNPERRAHCARCERARDEVLTAFSPEGVSQALAQRRESQRLRARAIRQQAARTLERVSGDTLRRAGSRRVRLAAAALALLTVAAAWFGPRLAAPALGYFSAESALQKGQYEQARDVFSSLGAYRDAEDRALDSRYQQGLALMEVGSEMALTQAETVFEELSGWQDSAEKALEARYRHAALTAQTRPAEAQAMFEALGDYRDSGDQARTCAYRLAREALQAGDDETALAGFVSLGDWSDSAAQAAAIRLRQGKAALDAGDIDSAISLLSESGGEEAVRLLRRAWYLKGHALYSAGEMSSAGQAFLSAGDYLDAQAQAKRCILGEARQAMDAGDNVAAMELLATIPGWEDADSLRREAILREAGQALEAKEYDRAASLLDYLPENDSAAADLRRETVYRPAAAALAEEDWLAAIDGFSAIEGYADSAEQLKRARYGQAGSLKESGDLAGAEAIWAALEDYADSGARLTETRYLMAGEALAEGQWEEAARLYALTAGYEDSDQKLIQAKTGAADEALAEGRVAEAREQYTALGNQQGLLDCDWADANALLEAGETQRAAEAFAALGDYPGAADKAREAWLQLAEISRKTGSYAEAAGFYRQAGDEESALAMLTIIEDQLYAEAAAAARKALEEGRALDAVRALGSLDMSLLPERYRDLPGMYAQACLQAAGEALDAEDLDTAWDCLSRAWLAEGADALRERAGWELLGPWANEEHHLTLRPDGTGEIDGESLRWTKRGYIIYDRHGREVLKLASRRGDRLNVRDVREGDEALILYRAEFTDETKEGP